MAYPNIKAELARKGMTQKELAIIVGVHESTFSQWVNGNTEPLISQALKIAKALDSSVDYLFAE